MMRGMFSAISGLKQHQVMLDVTANDISNVNTIGYKSARVTFQDSLNQLQRGAAGANTNTGGSNAAQVGLGVGLGSIDNLMTGGTRQTTGNPLDVSIEGDGFFQIARGQPDRRQLAAHADQLHPRRQLLGLQRGLPDHVDRPVRRRLPDGPGHGQPDRDRSRDQDPGRRHRRRHRPHRRRVLGRRHHGQPRHRLPPDDRHVLERLGPRALRRQRVDAVGQLRPEDRQHAGHRRRRRTCRRARSRCPTWTSRRRSRT